MLMDVLSLGTSWNDFMLPAAIRAALILFCTGAIAWMVWSQSARLRSLIWTAGLVSALLIPLSPYQPVSVSIGMPALPAFLDRDGSTNQQPAPSDSEVAGEPSPVENLISEVPLSLGNPDPSSTLSIPREPVDVAARIAGGLGLIWLAGVALLLARMLAGFARHTVRARRLQAIEDGPWVAEAGRIRAELGIRRRVRLLAGDAGCGPQTWGVLNPAVLIPAHDDDLDAEARRAVLRHELAHVARYDALWLTLERVLTALYWWNPLFWLATRQAHLAREQSCDDVVLERGGRPSDYASQLLEQARGLLRRPNPEFPSLLPRSDAHLKRRISRILDPEARRQAPPRMMAALLILPLLLASCSLAAVDAQIGSTATPEANSEGGEEIHIEAAGDDSDDTSVFITDERGRLAATISGELTFLSDSEIGSISPGGSLTIIDERETPPREINAVPGESGIVFTYSVDGVEQPLDEAGQAWFDATLLDLFRLGGLDAPARVDRFIQEGGVDALLAETGAISSDVMRAYYLELALGLPTLDDASRLPLIESLPRLIESDFERARVIMTVETAALAGSPEQREALLDAAASLSGAPVEQRQALEHILPGFAGDESGLAAGLIVAGEVESDFELTQILLDAAPQISDAGPALDAWLAAAGNAESSFELAMAYRTLLLREGATAALRMQVIASIGTLEGDHDKAEVLIEAAPLFRATEEMRAAYRNAAATIQAEFDRGRALAALEG